MCQNNLLINGWWILFGAAHSAGFRCPGVKLYSLEFTIPTSLHAGASPVRFVRHPTNRFSLGGCKHLFSVCRTYTLYVFVAHGSIVWVIASRPIDSFTAAFTLPTFNFD